MTVNCITVLIVMMKTVIKILITITRIFRSLIEGANHQVNQVHNAVNHAGKNKWSHICLNMQYLIEKGIVPNPTHPEYTAEFGNHQF